VVGGGLREWEGVVVGRCNIDGRGVLDRWALGARWTLTGTGLNWGGRWTSGKTTERQDGPARFSKQPASGTKGNAGAGGQARVETEGPGGPGIG
jgi:hypothetical protein